MEGTITPNLERVVAHVLKDAASSTPRRIIAIAGVPGAGKSTLATQLAQEINRATQSDTMIALGMDGFHLTKAALSQFPDPAEAFRRRGAPWTFDPDGLHARLTEIRAAAGRDDVAWPGFEHAVGDPVEGATIVGAATRIVLVEGLYLLHQADGWAPVGALFDERWYLDVPLDLAMERLALRHMDAWGISRADAEARIRSNDRLNGEIVLESRHRADWLLIQPLAADGEYEIRPQ